MSISSIASTWASAMWTACWQGGLLILAVWALCRVFRRLGPGARQTLWWLGCLKLLLGILWARAVPIPLLPAPAQPVHSTLAHQALATADTASLSALQQQEATFPWQQALLIAWLAGLGVAASVSLRSGLRARQLVRAATPIDESPAGAELRGLAVQMGLHSPPRLMRAEGVTAPLVVGQLRPSILVPDDFESRLSLDEQRMALAHELAHVRRGDLWLAIVPSAAYMLFYFFPPVWLACREWAADREASCDAEALAATGAPPKAYGQLLLKIVMGDHRRAVAGLGATANFNTLRRRIALMKADSAPSKLGRFSRLALVPGMLLLVPWSLTAQTRVQGVVVNPGMEEGRDQPSGWRPMRAANKVQLVWDRGMAHTGKSSLRITREDDRYFPISDWGQEVPYDGKSNKIEFGAWIKADHMYKSVLDVRFYTDQMAGHAWVAYIGAKKPGDPPANHDWTWYSGIADIPPGTKRISIALQDYGGGTVWMDDVSVSYPAP